jgi:lipopolysaccharide export system protein LptA
MKHIRLLGVGHLANPVRWTKPGRAEAGKPFASIALTRSVRLFGLIFFLWLAIIPTTRAQFGAGQPGPGRPPGKPAEQVEILGADSLSGINQPGLVTRRLKGNVRLRQKGVLMLSNLALQNVTNNAIEAFGNVRMIQGDTISVRGDTMYYDGYSRQTKLRGHVVMRDRRMTLSTAQLDYDLATGIAHYPVSGRIVDKENVLTSREGYYDTRSKQFTFIDKVKLVNPKTTLTADSLLYNSLSRVATFKGPTRIANKDGVLLARAGQYNTASRVSNFQQRATAETPDYTLTGDTLYYDNVTELGIARGHAVLVSKNDKTIITGDLGRYNGAVGISRVTGHGVVKSVVGDQDTLFLRADTLFSYDNKATKTRKLVGKNNVLVFKSDLQSKCDSLVYDVADSTIYFYKKPIIWSDTYQMEADSMTAKMKHNRIETMLLRGRSFIVAQDTIRNFNQVKGRTITAYFQTVVVKDTLRPGTRRTTTGPITTGSGSASATVTALANPAPGRSGPEPPARRSAPVGPPTRLSGPAPVQVVSRNKTTLDRVQVEGNGQSIYFAVDDKNKLIGLNHVECSRMTIEFARSRVNRIRFYGRPDAQFVPPQEFSDDKKQLDGFRWRTDEKPTKAQTLWQAEPVKNQVLKPKSRTPIPQARILQDITNRAKPNATAPVLRGKR